jgi:hypothetical protein
MQLTCGVVLLTSWELIFLLAIAAAAGGVVAAAIGWALSSRDQRIFDRFLAVLNRKPN